MRGLLLIIAAWAAVAGAVQVESDRFVEVAWYWGTAVVCYWLWWQAGNKDRPEKLKTQTGLEPRDYTLDHRTEPNLGDFRRGWQDRPAGDGGEEWYRTRTEEQA